jgi:hypothetical protein
VDGSGDDQQERHVVVHGPDVVHYMRGKMESFSNLHATGHAKSSNQIFW